MRGPDSQSLRVALLSPCYWPEVRRGSERFVRELATGLIARGHRPSLITSHPRLLRRSVEDGLPIVRLPRPPEGRLRRHFEPWVTHVPLSYLALRAGEFDFAHAVYPSDGLAAAWWRRKTGRPAVLSYMGIPEEGWLNATRGRLSITRSAINGCDRTVVLSDHAAAVMRQTLGTSPEVIAPGVNLDAFSPRPGRTRHPTIACSAAVGEPRKNVALLIKALSLVREVYPDAVLVLSKPKDIEDARRVGADLGAAGVEWRNLDDRAVLARTYAEAWVAALPSIGEAFGLVLLEALACGTPVVGYDYGAIPSIIDRPEIGRMFGELDSRALAGALVEAMKLAHEPQTVDSCRARAAEFSTDVCVEQYLDLYRRLTSRARCT